MLLCAPFLLLSGFDSFVSLYCQPHFFSSGLKPLTTMRAYSLHKSIGFRTRHEVHMFGVVAGMSSVVEVNGSEDPCR